MYGYFLDSQATRYLAEIGAVSRGWATAVLMTERERSDRVRVWMHEVLEHLAWNGLHIHCGCPLAENKDWNRSLVIRVRGFLRAVSNWAEQRTVQEGTTTLAFIDTVTPIEAAQAVHNWPELRLCFQEVDDEVGGAYAERSAAREQMIRENEAGKF